MAFGCDPVGVAELDRVLDDAESAFASLDIEGFLAETEAVREMVPCMVAPASTALAARLHRMEGLRAFGERSVDAVRFFAASRALDPGYTFPEALAPTGSPLLDDYFAMDVGAGARVPVPATTEGQLWFDGVVTASRPSAWSTVFQWVDAAGEVRVTAYVPRDQPLPPYPAALPDPEPPPDPGAGTVVVREARDLRLPLGVSAGAAALATAGLYTAAVVSRRAWDDPATPDAELDGLKARTNGLVIASGITGLAAAGFGVGLAITW